MLYQYFLFASNCMLSHLHFFSEGLASYLTEVEDPDVKKIDTGKTLMLKVIKKQLYSLKQ